LDIRGKGLDRSSDRDQTHAAQDISGTHEVCDKFIRGVTHDLERRRRLNYPTVPHHDNSIGKPDGLLDIVRDKQDRLIESVVDSLEFFLQTRSGDRVQSTERLIHQEGSRLCSQCSRQADALLFPARQLGRIPVCIRLRWQSDQRQQVVDPGLDASLVPFEQIGNDCDVITDSHVGEET